MIRGDDPNRFLKMYVSHTLINQRQKIGMTKVRMGERMGSKMGMSSHSAYNVISNYENGIMYGTSSKRGIKFNGRRYMTRLAIYIQELYNDEVELKKLIECIRHIDNRFVYPPAEASLPKKHRNVRSTSRLL